MASPYQQSSSSNGKNEPGHPEELREISFSLEPSASSVRLTEYNLKSQHETISKNRMERWFHEIPPESPWTPYTPYTSYASCAGGIEQRGQQPPTPCLPPRLAEQPISGGNGGGDSPRCARCNARVCIKDIFVERC